MIRLVERLNPWWLAASFVVGVVVMPASKTEGVEVPSLAVDAERHKEVQSEEMTLLEQLQARMKELDEREQQIREEGERLERLRRDIEELAAQQAKEAERLQQYAKERQDQVSRPLVHLVKVYEAMDPEEAATRIEKMDRELALEILSGIKGKKAAVVLAGVNPEKAAKLSQGLRFFQGRKGSRAK